MNLNFIIAFILTVLIGSFVIANAAQADTPGACLATDTVPCQDVDSDGRVSALDCQACMWRAVGRELPANADAQCADEVGVDTKFCFQLCKADCQDTLGVGRGCTSACRFVCSK